MSNWQMNAAGDWELKTPDCRYRIEEWAEGAWLYRKPLELSAYSQLLDRYDNIKEAKNAVSSFSKKTKHNSRLV